MDAGNTVDVSDRDGVINMQNWPFYGMYQPDAIDMFSTGGNTYIVSANEGDARDYDTFSEEDRVKDITIDSIAFPNRDSLQLDDWMGRLEITNTLGDTNNDGRYEEIYGYGARSWSIWDALGNLVWDSEDELETVTAAQLPNDFNSTNDDNSSFDSRSDAKGPEPEAIAVAEFGGTWYAFIGLERIGGIMTYDLSTPTTPQFEEYINNRNFSVPADSMPAEDLGVEDIVIIDGPESPNGIPLLVTANEVSGTVSVFQINGVPTSIDNPIEDEETLSVYPNPAADILFVSKVGMYSIYTMDGALIRTVNETDRIMVNDLPTGSYLIRDLNSDESLTFIKK